MRFLVATALGLFAGVLLFIQTAMLFLDINSDRPPSSASVLVVFLGGWALASYLMVRRTRSTSTVFARGFLIGAAQWFAMIPTGFIYSARSARLDVGRTGGESELAGIAIFTILAGGVAVFMVLICLLGYAIAYFVRKEMSDDPTSLRQTHEPW